MGSSKHIMFELNYSSYIVLISSILLVKGVLLIMISLNMLGCLSLLAGFTFICCLLTKSKTSFLILWFVTEFSLYLSINGAFIHLAFQRTFLKLNNSSNSILKSSNDIDTIWTIFSVIGVLFDITQFTSNILALPKCYDQFEKCQLCLSKEKLSEVEKGSKNTNMNTNVTQLNSISMRGPLNTAHVKRYQTPEKLVQNSLLESDFKERKAKRELYLRHKLEKENNILQLGSRNLNRNPNTANAGAQYQSPKKYRSKSTSSKSEIHYRQQ
eukprot:NODE_85_length_22232_cov_1.318619.p9 type:complete len:269 gc:universal NODE_85_length_22232_cov_1.318619:502-1308(+)